MKVLSLLYVSVPISSGFCIIYATIQHIRAAQRQSLEHRPWSLHSSINNGRALAGARSKSTKGQTRYSTHIMLHLGTGCIAGCGFLTSEVRSENLKARNCGCPLPPGVCSVLSHGNCVKQEWALLVQEAQHSLPPILSLPVSWQLAQVLSTSSLNVDLLVGTLLMKSAAAGGLPHQSAGGVQALEFINRHVAVFF